MAWECLRGTSYLYPTTSISDEDVAAYQAAGFELALHPNTGCTFAWTEQSLRNDITTQLADAAGIASRASPRPVTNRTHCVAWSDWATQPKVEHDFGMRLDTNYYTYPAAVDPGPTRAVHRLRASPCASPTSTAP